MASSNEDLRRELDINLRRNLHQFVRSVHAIASELNSMADELDEHFRKINISKISGSTAAIVGGTLATVGFALSFFTFGASMGLAIAGGVIAGAGGVAAGGASIAEIVLSRKRTTALSEAINQFNKEMISLQEECLATGNSLQKIGNVDEQFKAWVIFWAQMVFHSGSTLKKVGWDLIGRTVLNAIRVSTYVDDFARVGVQGGATAFKTIGSTAGRALHVAGGVFGIVMMPIDIYTLVDSSIDLHKKNPHKVSQKLRETAAGFLRQCPTDEAIDQMIENTLRQLQ